MKSGGIPELYIEDLHVPFPFETIYPEQIRYMHALKKAIDQRGQGLIEMPTGTGKTVSVLALALAYQHAYPEVGKIVFCTRTVPEMSKALNELRVVQAFQHAVFSGDSVSSFLAIGLSARKNMCVNEGVLSLVEAEQINASCRQLTTDRNSENSGCGFFSQFRALSDSGQLGAVAGVYTIDDLKLLGIQQGFCPYFASRKLLQRANLVVFSYQYLLDPRVAASAPLFAEKISNELANHGLNIGASNRPVGAAGPGGSDGGGSAIVIFDEAHNIDDVCLESLTVRTDVGALEKASQNLKRLTKEVETTKKKEEHRLKEEVDRLMQGLVQTGHVTQGAAESIKVSNLLTTQDRNMIIPGSIRKAENFLSQLNAVLAFLKQYIRVDRSRVEGPLLFCHKLDEAEKIDVRSLRAFSLRLRSLVSTLKITDVHNFTAISDVCEIVSLAATHVRGFALLSDPFPESEGIYQPTLELCCLDASIPFRNVLDRFGTVVLTSGTLSPLNMYPKLLGMKNVKVSEALEISLAREAIRPLIVTKGNDQTILSSKFDLREDADVLRNYGHLLEEITNTVPDGIVVFFTSKLYMRRVVQFWFESGLLSRLAANRPLFFETEDVVETTVALANYRKACDAGCGGLFFSIARGKVSEGIDFDRHYGKAVVMFGIPFQYTLSKKLRARLEYIKETHGVSEAEFLTFDAMRAAAQCVGRVLRSKQDYGVMVFADFRYSRADKRSKLPTWIGKFISPSLMNLSVDQAMASCREFLLNCSQPFDENAKTGAKPSRLHAHEVRAWMDTEYAKGEKMEISKDEDELFPEI